MKNYSWLSGSWDWTEYRRNTRYRTWKQPSALDLIIDIDTLENRNDYKVRECEGVQGELEGLTYLCWRVSPKYSCVIEYPTGMISEKISFTWRKA